MNLISLLISCPLQVLVFITVIFSFVLHNLVIFFHLVLVIFNFLIIFLVHPIFYVPSFEFLVFFILRRIIPSLSIFIHLFTSGCLNLFISKSLTLFISKSQVILITLIWSIQVVTSKPTHDFFIPLIIFQEIFSYLPAISALPTIFIFITPTFFFFPPTRIKTVSPTPELFTII
jgi:hypothetical protein